MKHRVACAPVRDLEEVVNDPHMHARRALRMGRASELGRVPLPNSPLRFEGAEPLAIVPSKRLGADNGAVFGGWLGLSASELDRLRREEVI